MKSRLLIGVALAAFAFASVTDVASAASRASAKRNKATPVAHGTVPNCGSGMVPVMHMVWNGNNTWSCVKPG
jgi:hypothetical protein